MEANYKEVMNLRKRSLWDVLTTSLRTLLLGLHPVGLDWLHYFTFFPCRLTTQTQWRTTPARPARHSCWSLFPPLWQKTHNLSPSPMLSDIKLLLVWTAWLQALACSQCASHAGGLYRTLWTVLQEDVVFSVHCMPACMLAILRACTT